MWGGGEEGDFCRFNLAYSPSPSPTPSSSPSNNNIIITQWNVIVRGEFESKANCIHILTLLLLPKLDDETDNIFGYMKRRC
jgi:hypothetical protein